MSRRLILLLGLIALALVSPAPAASAWVFADSKLTPIPLTMDVKPVQPINSFDFDGDARPETIELANDQASIRSDKQIRWKSPSAWKVLQAQVADLNNDGLPEVILLVLRPFKPWPVDAWLPNGGRISQFHDSAGRSCHLILLGWNGSAFRERWAGSAMAEPFKAFAVGELAGNGKQLLVALESQYDDLPSAPAEKLKVWEWNGFGFSIVSQVSGAFNHLAIAREDNGRLLILAP